MSTAKSLAAGFFSWVLVSWVLGSLVAANAARRTPAENASTRNVLAVKYVGHTESVVDIVGTAIAPKARGRAEVEFKDGRSQIRLDMGNLGNPQSLGALYTTFILWAVAPEGQADNIADKVYPESR